MKTNFKYARGITLIALVITIVVLLILAGVSLNLVLENNGIITKAQDAKIITRAGSVDDEIDLWKTDSYIAKNTNGSSESENDMLQRLRDNKLITADDEVDTTNKIIKIKKKDGTVVKEISYKQDVEIIKFTIDSIEYQAEKEMTWAEWCESRYNSLGLINSGNSIMSTGGLCITRDPNSLDEAVNPDEIIAELSYYFKSIAECVTPDSQILVGLSGETIMAKEIKEDDEIAYYDFDENNAKMGKVSKVYIHKNAMSFVRYEFSDGTYLEATDYHPIYTKDGWKSLTRRNGYEVPQIGDEVRTLIGWKEITRIESYIGLEDCYDFAIITENGTVMNNYYANGTLVQGSY